MLLLSQLRNDGVSLLLRYCEKPKPQSTLDNPLSDLVIADLSVSATYAIYFALATSTIGLWSNAFAVQHRKLAGNQVVPPVASLEPRCINVWPNISSASVQVRWEGGCRSAIEFFQES